MKRFFKQILALSLSLILTSAVPLGSFAVFAADAGENLALNKPASASKLEAGATEDKHGAHLTVDGNTSTNVSLAKDIDDPYVTIDLGQIYSLTTLAIHFESCPAAYELQVSQDGAGFQAVGEKTRDGLSVPVTSKLSETDIFSLDSVKARYVRYQQKKGWQWNLTTRIAKMAGNPSEIEVYGAPIVSEEGVNLALGKPASASKLETGATEETHGAHLTVDGNTSTHVSLAKDIDDPSIIIDLERVVSFDNIVIRFESCPQSYEILVSQDGSENSFVKVGGKEREELGSPVASPQADTDSFTFDTIQARYVKYQQIGGWQWDLSTRIAKMAGNPSEIEVYKTSEFDKVMRKVEQAPPTLDLDNGKIILPSTGSSEYSISLEGSDNQQVITNEGDIHRPLVDMTVNLVYRVTSNSSPEKTAIASKNAVVTVPGLYQAQKGDNPVPNVMPGLREWKGKSGNYRFSEESSLVISSQALRPTAEMIAGFFSEMLGKTPAIEVGTPSKGDILLTLDESAAALGAEGYQMDIGDILTIAAPAKKGLLYGGTSVVQILYQEPGHALVPMGLCRDYPKYEVRAGMIDVGRMFIPIDYLEQIARYMAWFKLNELHVHINDDISYDNAFRVESKKYPQINSTGQYYTQEEYRQFQKNVRPYGIDIVTEIDAPAHASALKLSGAVDMLSGSYMDITTDASREKTLAFIQDLCDEFLDGEDPVFQSSKFHIGTDEYSTAYPEQMRAYTDAMIKYVNGKGLETRLWGSCSQKAPLGFKGSTPVSNQATMNLWDPKWTDVQEMYDDGYQIINTTSGHLYIVPGGAGHPVFHPDRLYLAERYKDFEVNIFKEFRTAEPYIMPLGLPQTKGAEFALWNDNRVGLSQYDEFDRMKDGIFLISEKTWFGEDTENQTAEDFLTRIDAVDDKAPHSNPGAFVDTQGSTVAGYDFDSLTDGIVPDLTTNQYDGAFNGNVSEGKNGQALIFTGKETLTLPIGSVGYPYTVSFDLKLDADNSAESELFSGKDGRLYFTEDGKLRFSRFYNYVYEFSAVLPRDTWMNITLRCTRDEVTLFIDGAEIAATYISAGASKTVSSTFVLPCETIGKNLKGRIDNLYLANTADDAELSAIQPSTAISVPFGTSFGDLPALPGTVDIILEGETTKIAVPVHWNADGYQPEKTGSYVLSGSLVLPSFIKNPQNLTPAISVTVEKPAYSITTAPVTGGTAAISVSKTAANENEQVTVSISNLEDGKLIDSILVTGQSGADIPVQPLSETTFQFTMPAEAVSISVKLKPEQMVPSTSALEKVISDAEKIVANIDKYQETGKTEFLAALDAAKAQLQNPVSQEAVYDATIELHNAILKLRLIPNKDALAALLETAKTYDLAKYTQETGAVLLLAIDTAESIYADSNATEEQIEAAGIFLQAAIDNLAFIDDSGDVTNPDDGDSSEPGDDSSTPDGDDSSTPDGDSSTPDDGNTSGGDKAPSTGSSAPIAFLALCALSLGAAVVLKKKK